MQGDHCPSREWSGACQEHSEARPTCTRLIVFVILCFYWFKSEESVTLVPECREIAKPFLNVDSVDQFQGLKWLTESTFRD